MDAAGAGSADFLLRRLLAGIFITIPKEQLVRCMPEEVRY